MPQPQSNRRHFLQAAALGTATAMTARSYARAAGANERCRIGVIGCGNRGHNVHMRRLHKHAKSENLEIAAVCDVWSKYRDRAATTAKEWFGAAPFDTSDYRALLDREDIDAVMIATCDFQHARMLQDAAAAGKDAYCEKPLAMNTGELKSACQAVKDNKIIVQIGTQRRSYPEIRGARKLLAENRLGKLSRIEFFRNMAKPFWYKRLSRMPVPASEVDWKRFLMHLPDRPFSDLDFAGWYGYRDFCGGLIGQFMSHYADLVNYLTGSTYPTSAVAHGATFVWDDEYKFTCRDQVQVSLIFPEGFLMTYSTNFGNPEGSRYKVYGTDATMTLGRKPNVASIASKESKAATPVEPIEGPDHFLDWFQALRSRKQPIAPIEAGHQHSIACIMADQALLTGRRQVYDRDRDEVRPG